MSGNYVQPEIYRGEVTFRVYVDWLEIAKTDNVLEAEHLLRTEMALRGPIVTIDGTGIDYLEEKGES